MLIHNLWNIFMLTLKPVSVGAKNPGGMCDYAAQYLVYYSDPPGAPWGVDREFPVVERDRLLKLCKILVYWRAGQGVWVSSLPTADKMLDLIQD